MNKKLGLIKYDWSTNLGDTAQSIATKRFFNPDLYFDRDFPSKTKISQEIDEVKIIANAYWAGFDGAISTWEKELPFDKKINPLWISSHFDGGCTFSDSIIEYFKLFEPIGCRDRWSQAKLDKLGIQSYFSNCMTITLKNTKKYRTDDIYIVDVPKNVYRYFPAHILNKAKFITHESKWSKDKIERGDLFKFDEMQELLDKYMSAKLVITNRLHCATPCIAFDTPVVFIGRKETFYRVDCLKEYIPLYTYEDVDLINWDIGYIKNSVDQQKKDFYKKLLTNKVNQFINNDKI